MLHFSSFTAWMRFIVAFVCLTGLARCEDRVSVAPKAKDSFENADRPNSPKVIKLSAKQFDEFFKKREEYCNALFDELIASHNKENDAAPDAKYVVYIEGPESRVGLTAKEIHVSKPMRNAPRAANLRHGDRGYVPSFGQMLPYFPDVTCVWFHSVPDIDFWRQLSQAPLLTAIRAFNSAEGEFSDETMQCLSQCAHLHLLELGRCQISEKGFRCLENLKNLEIIKFGGNPTPRTFITLAKLPKLTNVQLGPFKPNSFAKPIDAETERAIGSMDGRLQFISVDEYSYQNVHISFARCFMRMKSLNGLWFCGIVGPMTPADFEPLLKMDKLDCFNIDPISEAYMEGGSSSQLEKIDEITEEVRKRGVKGASFYPRHSPAKASNAHEG
jgi:hypothetical protein